MATTNNKNGLITPHAFCYEALDEIRDKMLRNTFNIGRDSGDNNGDMFQLAMEDRPYNKVLDQPGYWTLYPPE